MPRKAGSNGTKTKNLDIVDGDGYLCLRGEDLWRYRAVDAEFHKLVAQKAALDEGLKNLLTKYPDVKELFDKRNSLAAELVKAQKNLTEVHQLIEAKFGVILTNCAIDDATGRLHELVNNKPGEPLKPHLKSKSAKRSAGPA